MEIITPAESDAIRIANIGVNAYEYKPLTRLLFTPPATDEIRKYFEDETKQTWGSMLRRAVKDTATGEIISYAAFSFVPADNGDLWKKPHHWHRPRDDLMNGDVMAHFTNLQHEQRVKHMGPTAFVHLLQLSTDPKAERRGAGSMLMACLTELADKYNLPIFLVATPQGKGLYEKHGFEEKEVFETDLSSINEPPRKSWSMIRPAAHPGEPHVVPAQPLKPVRIEPVKADMEECRDFERCTDEAFSADPLVQLCFFNAEHESLDERANHIFERLQKPDEFLMEKAVDPDTNEVLGYSKWMLASDPQKKMYPFSREWPRGANVACCEAVMGKLSRHREEYFREHNLPYAYMASLMIRPKAQRRGVGSALLRSGLKLCDERGWKAYIDASPSGALLYRKFGWKDDFSATVNLKDYGGPDHTSTILGLLRHENAEEVPRNAVGS